jgi:uroporphyrinogen decarboxylase
VMIFDSWGGVLADGAFQSFSLAYTRRVLQGLQREADGRRVPHIVFTKGGGPWLEAIGALGADVVGVDWTVNLGQARARVGNGVALQGNLDPTVLFAGAEAIRGEVAAALAGFHAGSATTRNGHVFNLGHGISQHTPVENVGVLVDAVHEMSRRYHAAPGA